MNTVKSLKLLWILVFLYIQVPLFSQNKAIANDQVQEKIFIHFDKPFYYVGETIFFKAYLYNLGYPSQLSHTFYLRLESEKGILVDIQQFAVSGSTAGGSFTLRDTLAQGIYRIRAATNSTNRRDAAFNYVRNILIANPAQPLPDAADKEEFSIQFFPESGQLVDRIRTQVAFKAVDDQGTPVNVSGVIRADSNTVLTAFNSFHDGIGKFSFTPRAGQNIYAEVTRANHKYTFPLPKVMVFGVNLKITDLEEGKRFEITRSKSDNQLFDTVSIVARMGSEVVFEDKIGFGFQNAVAGILRTTAIPSGILHFTILNRDGVPLAERLTFVNNKEYSSPATIKILKRDSSERSHNRLELNFPDTTQKSISISVTDMATSSYPDSENILSRFLLSSELKGYIHNPGYYFKNDDPASKEALDNLMLTHGWTRYSWIKQHGSFSLTSNDHYLIRIKGSVKDLKNNKPVSPGTLNLQLVSEDSTIQGFSTSVKENGQFALDSLLFYGTAKIYYTYTNASGKEVPVHVTLDRDYIEELSTSFIIDSAKGVSNEQLEKIATISMRSINQGFDPKYKQLNNIVLKTKLMRPADKLNDSRASLLFKNSGRLVLDNINNPYIDKSLSVIEYILNNIRTVDIYRDQNILVNRKNFSLMTGKNWKVEVLVNEAVSNIQNVRSITMDKVAMIKFYEAGFLGAGSDAPGGAVAIYLKKYDESEQGKTIDKSNFILYKGYAISKDFYHPDYSIKNDRALQDARVTLYWNSTIATGKLTCDFFNNDFSKKLHVVVQGFDNKGKLIHYDGIL